MINHLTINWHNVYKNKANSLPGIKFTQNLSVLFKSVNDLLEFYSHSGNFLKAYTVLNLTS